MFVLPVIDLQDGWAVHGRAGRRTQYQPVRSVLAQNAHPATLAGAFVDQLGLTRCYLADLDAIAGRPAQTDHYRKILEQGIRELWVDAAVSAESEVHALRDAVGDDASGRLQIVVGLETLAGERMLLELLRAFSSQQIVVSLDLQQGRPLSRVAQWCKWPATRLASHLIELGVRRMILLDLARVGTGEGTGTVALLRQLRSTSGEVEWVCGGGIAGMRQVQQLAAAGCHGILLATTLHDGTFGPREMRQIERCASLDTFV